MIPFKLDLVIDEVTSKSMAAQGMIQASTGKVVRKEEALQLWNRIDDHKWYLSERLGRDVGVRVAAVDYIDNFYEPVRKKTRDRGWFSFVRKSSGNASSIDGGSDLFARA